MFSSSPSEQSLVPSHKAVVTRQFPPWQANLLEGHAQFSSSEPSLQARSPSHKKFFFTHSPLAHLNWLSLHLKPRFNKWHLNQMKNDPRSCDRNFYNCVKKPEKNSGLQRGLNPWPRDTGATLYQLSYEATDVGSRSILGSYVPVKDM